MSTAILGHHNHFDSFDKVLEDTKPPIFNKFYHNLHMVGDELQLIATQLATDPETKIFQYQACVNINDKRLDNMNDIAVCHWLWSKMEMI